MDPVPIFYSKSGPVPAEMDIMTLPLGQDYRLLTVSRQIPNDVSLLMDFVSILRVTYHSS